MEVKITITRGMQFNESEIIDKPPSLLYLVFLFCFSIFAGAFPMLIIISVLLEQVKK